VLHDPFANQFFRLRPAAYEFIARLRSGTTVQQAWEETMSAVPDDAPGQEEAIRLLAQLYHANLLRSEVAGDTAKLFERHRKRRSQEVRSKLASIMFARIPLLDPDDFLKRTLWLAKLLIGPVGIVLWLAVVGYGLKVAADHFDALWAKTDAVLAPANLPWLYLSLVVIKAIHEFGHAYACRRFGGEVHVMGIMFLIFTPVPFVDATASWNFRSRWQRILVAAAGMIVEVFVAAIAIVVWANTGGGVLHGVAFNMVFIASVTTLLFNANPLLRFDGYYILCDLLDMPNLHTRSAKLARHWVERHAFGVKKARCPEGRTGEKAILGSFFVASNIYKVVVFAGIILFVADRFLLLGIAMLLVCAVSWVIRPAIGLVRYLATDTALARNRPRAVMVTLAFFAGLVGLLWVVPVPDHFRAPGVVQSRNHREVFGEAPGYLREIVRASGAEVAAGEPVLRLEDPELAWRRRVAVAQLEEAEVDLRMARAEGRDVRPQERRVEAFRQSLERLGQTEAALVVRAPVAGRWISPRLDENLGLWLQRGIPLGHVVQDEFRFSAAVPQQQAAELFNGKIRGAEVRIPGQAAEVVAVGGSAVIPAQQQVLPSAALGWRSGGGLTTAEDDPTGRQATEPFFEVRADLHPDDRVRLVHGCSGEIRFTREPLPLLRQWWRNLRQLIQKRYEI
jgi:putative peptide zinc metalloprotease protein